MYKNFVLKEYPDAYAMGNAGYVIMSNRILLGFGNSEEDAWGDAFMKMMYPGLR